MSFYKEYFFKPNGGTTLTFYVVLFAPFILGLVIQNGYRRISLGILTFLFIVYSALMGMTLGIIFLIYSIDSIAITFFISAGAFAAMAILGYTTKTDLTKFGSLLYMALIGMMIAMVVNFFMNSSMLDYIVSIVGVFVFTGLTAYYMQNLKGISQDETLSEIDRSKLSLIGGILLYITFVNLFLTLLRLFGGGSRE
jgi:FtsH-binding integral membrane protein